MARELGCDRSGYDNLLKTAGGKAFRVDAGGALLYGAQGGLQGGLFGEGVPELDTMRTRYSKPSSVFDGMTQQQLQDSASRVVDLSDDTIRTTVERFEPGGPAARKKLADTLIARRNDIRRRLGLQPLQQAA